MIGKWQDPATGGIVAHRDVLARAAVAQAVLLGEQHDRAAQHRWQLHVLAGLLAHRSDIVVGYEMFPARLDPVLADWVAGGPSEQDFLERAEWRTVWNFDPQLYLPLFRFCREFRLPMIGLNCRRDLVSAVGKLGWEQVELVDRDGVTPPVSATPAHRQHLFDLTGGRRPDRAARGPQDPAFDRFVRAQQVWDRAFACRIAAARDRSDAPLVVGIIGRGHMEYGYGTPEQLGHLGVHETMVLLPSEEPVQAPEGIADAVFHLDPREHEGS